MHAGCYEPVLLDGLKWAIGFPSQA
jgi:hypothetical protein